jgi:hypothetical protein
MLLSHVMSVGRGMPHPVSASREYVTHCVC